MSRKELALFGIYPNYSSVAFSQAKLALRSTSSRLNGFASTIVRSQVESFHPKPLVGKPGCDDKCRCILHVSSPGMSVHEWGGNGFLKERPTRPRAGSPVQTPGDQPCTISNLND
jgi:hypothetical protein